jgi:hypothetical protein
MVGPTPPGQSPEWIPEYARPERRAPEVGWLIGWNHAAWRVVSVVTLPSARWTPEIRQQVGARVGGTALRMTLRPVGWSHPDPLADRSKDVALDVVPGSTQLHVFADEHYPVCAVCREPPPCRERWAERFAVSEMARMARYETAGVCPACKEPVAPKQRQVAFDENVVIPGGPPVVFHLRVDCLHQAEEYEKAWVRAAPERRRTSLTCPGSVTNHGDGTYDCTEWSECRGPRAKHAAYAMCRCSDCHINGPFGSRPRPDAVRNPRPPGA